MEILQVENLSFCYPERAVQAIENITFSIERGSFCVVCGGSGCGKSTLLKRLKRELAPYGIETGKIRYQGVLLSQLDDRTAAGAIGFISQDPESQIVTDTVWHELAFGLENQGLPTATIRRRVAETASYFGLEGWLSRKTATLSGGQKQLLNLAAVMAMRPEVLLLDEPTAQLDPIAAERFMDTLRKLNREGGLTILMAEHRLDEAFSVADRALLLEGGRLVYAGSPRGISSYFKEHPAHPLRAGLPAAMRIFGGADEEKQSPLTVREGREYLWRHYDNAIDRLEETPYVHSPEKAVELKEVWFRYEREWPDVMRGTTLTVYRGEHVCLLGGNGTGKTTLLNVMAGLLKAYRGEVRIDQKRITAYRGNALYLRCLALLPQNVVGVFLHKTVREDLQESCLTLSYTPKQAAQKVEEMAHRLAITDLLEWHPYDLSGGEQQKAAFAKVLLLEPKILLLDEPTKGIDAGGKEVLANLIKRLKEESQITVITVTHDVEFAAACADRCGLFFDGELLSIDPPTHFFQENHFYTTAAYRIARGYYQNAILCEQVAALCRLNRKSEVSE